MFVSRRRALQSMAGLSLGPLAPAAMANGESSPGPTTAGWVHAYAAFGQPKYPTGFPHFDYVNPDAPKGGTINLRNPDRRSSFDKFNPFTTKGNAPAGMSRIPGSRERLP